MILYDYFRSSACYRVRIALNVKQCAYEKIEVHLVNQGGEHHTPEYHKINPQELIPTLEVDGKLLSQSLAIIEYLEEVYPEPALFPKDPLVKTELRSMALMIACDLHPLNNLRVLSRLRDQFNANQAQVTDWYYHWLKTGFDAFEAKLGTLERTKMVCFGETASLADVCLIPQVYNAKRFNFDMIHYPLINEINDYCLTLPEFKSATPIMPDLA